MNQCTDISEQKIIEVSSLHNGNSINESLNWISNLQTEHFKQVEQRVIRQLLRTLIYEDIYPYEFQKKSDKDKSGVFILQGKTAENQLVEYHCYGEIMQSFDHIKPEKTPVLRISRDNQSHVASLQDVINEVLCLIPDAKHLSDFINEIEQTLLKDIQARNLPRSATLPEDQRQYDALESNLRDAHTYHPCYKSRIGFSLTDNQAYGPEFKQSLQLAWVAISKKNGSMNHTKAINYNDFIRQELGEHDYQAFTEALQAKDKSIDDFWLMPVHPWQWKNIINTTFYLELANENIIYLGIGSEQYLPQQSIRTLANVSDKEKSYVKFALSITNTSSTRILANHTVKNGPIIADWLHGLLEKDSVAKQLGFVILGEVVGVTYDYQNMSVTQKAKAHGSLGTIWRESLHKYLHKGESAAPFNGLFHLEGNGAPLIEPWIKQYGLDAWVTQLLKVTVNPIIHMLFAHGIGMESHAQNIVLIHKDGWPTRIALKDFHDGVRYSPDHLGAPEQCPTLFDVPEMHTKLNRNSFILTDELNDVRDFSCDAFFFICLSELCIFLNQSYQLPEERFWSLAAEIVKNYQSNNSQHTIRFSQFDLFAETFVVGQFTKRRIFGDAEARVKQVNNPLYVFKL
jgi:siderophore synthetase component